MEKKPTAIKIQGFEPKCPICFEDWNALKGIGPWVLSCGHMICERCFIKHKKNTKKCHMCREKFNLTKKRRKKQKAKRIERNNIVKVRIEEYYSFQFMENEIEEIEEIEEINDKVQLKIKIEKET